MSLIVFILYIAAAYFTYVKSGKYNTNPYLWVAIGLLVPFISLPAAFLYFRGKPVNKPNASKIPLGYRTRTPWKMVLATIVYGLWLLVVGIGVMTDTPAVEPAAGVNNKTAANSTVNQDSKKNTEAVGSDQDDANEGNTNEPADKNGSGNGSDQDDATAQQTADGPMQTVTGQLKVHFIDVGQADSILIEDGTNAMLIDAGNNADSNLVANYIRNQGFKKLTYVIGTHPDEDHIGGLDVAIRSFDVGKVIMPKAEHTTKTYEDVLFAIKDKGLKITPATPGAVFRIGSGTFTILAPNGDGYEDMNNFSVVIRLEFGDTSFLLTGDAEDVSEQEILNKGYNVKSDVLKVGHHGSSSSTTPAFLNRVNPVYAVISVGDDNKYGHPYKSTMDLLKSKGIKVYRTDESGTIIATTDGKTISFNTKPGTYVYSGSGGSGGSSGSGTTGTANDGGTTEPKPDPKSVSAGDIGLVDLTDSVEAGSVASITIKGKPGVTYDITVSYKAGPSSASGLEPKKAGADGKVTWSWKVGARTSAGTWPIEISGGGKTYKTSFNVYK